MLDSLTASPSLSELAEPEARMIGAVRLSVALSGAGQCPIQAVAEKLGSLRTAAHLHLLLDEIAAAWPEPFAVGPICGRGLSHDEAALAEMLRLGRKGDRPTFDRLLAEMIPADERERLFISAAVINRSINSLPRSPPEGRSNCGFRGRRG